MGEQKVSLLTDKAEMHEFMKSLLNDVQALEYMLENDWFEDDIVRIGAEQEMALVNNKTLKPAFIAMEALDKLKEYDWAESELSKFNLETNITPRELKAKCFSEMEDENTQNLAIIRQVLAEMDSSLILTGILPTLRKFDLNIDNLTPKKRYKALIESISAQLRKTAFQIHLVGIDELHVKHDSPLIEACNTSFQVHLQVKPKEFVKMYNIAQALAAPVMAIAANSPIVFGKRLWHESRIVLFQQSLDTRSTHDHMRESKPRVSFGSDWLQDSLLDIYREDIARFRVLISGDQKEDALALIKEGKVPKLRALQVHNSTVYRWNRPCYGISSNGKPHLRIENRVLPSGPTILDEMANACLWLGVMVGMADEIEDIRDHLSFADVRDNFSKAAKFGIDSTFNWFGDVKVSACDLVRDTLLPLAEKGLKSYGVDANDIDKYLSVIRSRADKHMNGARWSLRAYTKLLEETSVDEALTVLTAAMIKNEIIPNNPVHDWKLPDLEDLKEYKPSMLYVSEFMATDIISVQEDDIVELAADTMIWRHFRYIPVENDNGNLVGLVTYVEVMKYLSQKTKGEEKGVLRIGDIMIKKPVTINVEATIKDALKLMRKHKIGCLPVVREQELVGIITEVDFLKISGRLIERM